MKTMRPSLVWVLGGTVVLTVASSWLPKPAVVAGTAGDAAGHATAALTTASQTTAAPGPVGAPAAARLPATLPAVLLEPAEADPFTAVMLPAPALPVAAIAPSPAPVLPAAPPMRYRYLGQMTDPAGQRWIYLGKDQQEMAAKVGSVLDDGYAVTAVEPGAVRLRHEASRTDAIIEIPAVAAEQ
ncbi:hypothetical protein [Roseateles sp. LYH14W]|uniref:Secreted protein n=1 Tax=Pelomonas parva TaxID=3299032 RepID=A0ABW7FC11_9BURK